MSNLIIGILIVIAGILMLIWHLKNLIKDDDMFLNPKGFIGALAFIAIGTLIILENFGIISLPK
jgi:hydrogenase-4 membrane subunit HyfE